MSAKALQALNQAYVHLHASTRHGVPYMQVTDSVILLSMVPRPEVLTDSHGRPLSTSNKHVQCRGQDWARILAKVNRTAEACELYEQLADIGLRGSHQHGSGATLAEQAVQLCLAAIKQHQGARSCRAPCLVSA